MKNHDLYAIFTAHSSISTDSRKVAKGDLFFALKGENFDGNAYALNALDLGAAYAVIDDEALYNSVKQQNAALTEQLFLVPDVLCALQNLANRHRRRLNKPVLGLTGTNGKTTTKELIAAVLSAKFKVCATQGNLNNHIGVPLTLLQMTEQTEIAVIEMGANHLGEIAELAAIAEPDYGLITNVGKAHLEGFGSLEGVMQTKSAIYKAASSIFLNVDDPRLCAMADERGKRASAYLYGFDFQKASMLPVDAAHPFLRMEIPGYPTIETRMVGSYNANNVLAALAVGTYFGVDPVHAADAIAHYSPSNNRSQWKQTTHNFLVIDAYNANPTSMAAALSNFEQLNVPHKTAIIGDMLELGAESAQEHLAIAVQLDRMMGMGVLETAFLVGPRLAEAVKKMGNNSFRLFTDVEVLRNYLEEYPLRGATILLKGSRGIRLERVLELL